MKSLNIIFIAITLVFLYLFAGCKKDQVDNEKPVIEIEELFQGDTVNVTTDSVHVEFHVTDNVELHEVKVEIKNAQDSIVYQDSQDVDMPSLQYHKHYIPKGTIVVVPLTMTIIASDHSGNEAIKSIGFYIKP